MILARAPLRLPLGGGGTDLPSYYERFGGFFVGAAIDKYLFVSVNRPASDDLIRVKYSRSEEVGAPNEVEHDLVRHALIALNITSNIEIASMADVSAGTGMGSSGSYLVALLLALHTLKRDQPPRWQLAEEACEIEIKRAGHPVGIQDQYVATWGGLNAYTIATDGSVAIEPLRVASYALDDLARCLLLFNTGQTRKADVILSRQKADTERNVNVVVDSLHRTKELGCKIKESLESGDLVEFGALLDQHWQNKKLRSDEVSSSKVDRIYAIARESGALGGKLIGAGGGGFLMLLARPDSIRRVRESVAAERMEYLPFRFEMDGAKVLLNV